MTHKIPCRPSYLFLFSDMHSRSPIFFFPPGLHCFYSTEGIVLTVRCDTLVSRRRSVENNISAGILEWITDTVRHATILLCWFEFFFETCGTRPANLPGVNAVGPRGRFRTWEGSSRTMGRDGEKRSGRDPRISAPRVYIGAGKWGPNPTAWDAQPAIGTLSKRRQEPCPRPKWQ